MTEPELWEQTRQLEKEKDEIRSWEKAVREREEEEDRKICEEYLKLEYMREHAGEDHEILFLIDEQRSLLDMVRMKKAEFDDDLEKYVKGKNAEKEEQLRSVRQALHWYTVNH